MVFSVASAQSGELQASVGQEAEEKEKEMQLVSQTDPAVDVRSRHRLGLRNLWRDDRRGCRGSPV